MQGRFMGFAITIAIFSLIRLPADCRWQQTNTLNLESRDGFVSWSPDSRRVLYSCGSTVYLYPGTKHISLGNHVSAIEFCSWAPQDNRAIVGDKYVIAELNFKDETVKYIEGAVAGWWNDGRVSYIHTAPNDKQTLFENGRKYAIPSKFYVTAASPDGRLLLARVNKPNARQNRVDSIAIGHYLGQGKFKFTAVPSEPLGARLIPGGDFITCENNKGESLIGLGVRTDGYKYSSVPFICNLNTLKLSKIWEDQFSFSAPQPSRTACGFVGIRRRLLNRPNQSVNRMHHYVFLADGVRVQYRPVDGDLLASGCGSSGMQCASVLVVNNQYVFVAISGSSLRAVRIHQAGLPLK